MTQPPGWTPPEQSPWTTPDPSDTSTRPASPEPSPYGLPGPAAPGQGQYGQPAPGYGQPAPGHGPTPGWGPGGGWRKPGIVPLRPLTLGEILDGAFRAIRSNPKTMIGMAAVVLAITSVISILPEAGLRQMLGEGLARTAAGGDPSASFRSGLQLGLADVPRSLLASLATTVLNAMLVVAVVSAVLGQKIAPGQLWQRVRRRVLAAIGLSLLTGLALGAIMVVMLIPAIIVAVTGHIGPAALLGLLGLLVALALTIMLATRWSLAAPALLLEDKNVFGALARSWKLSSGSFWRILGIEVVGYLLVGVGSALIAFPFAIVNLVVQALADNMTYQVLWANIVSSAISGLSTTVAGSVFTPWFSAVIALLYMDLRMRREGLDLELLRTPDAGTPA